MDMENYKRNDRCRFCNAKRLHSILDFGNVALAGGFLLPRDFKDERKYPLELCICEECCLLQVVNVVSAGSLFKNYFYFSSAIGTLRNHFEDYARDVSDRFLSKSSLVVEIGSNDGVLLRPFRALGMRTLGVDPARNIVQAQSNQGIEIVNDFFSEQIAEAILQSHGPADVIAANNVYAHIDNMHDVTSGIYKLLGPDGVFVFEAHYVGNLIEEVQYDMIYHEHLSYYSLLALQNFFKQFDMEVFDIKPIPIHAGSMRYYVRKVGRRSEESVSERVKALREQEVEKRYAEVATYLEYRIKVEETREGLLRLLRGLRKANKSIVGYGASGRASTMIQYCGIDKSLIDYIVDDAPAKQGYYTPGSHFSIKPRGALLESPPDYLLVFAWAFVDEVKVRCREYLEQGGKLIVPLPSVRIISFDDGEESVNSELHRIGPERDSTEDITTGTGV